MGEVVEQERGWQKRKRRVTNDFFYNFYCVMI